MGQYTDEEIQKVKEEIKNIPVVGKFLEFWDGVFSSGFLCKECLKKTETRLKEILYPELEKNDD